MMTVLQVPDMHCGMCVARITAAFGEANIPCEINLEAKTVTVTQDQMEQAIEELDDLGFDASV